MISHAGFTLPPTHSLFNRCSLDGCLDLQSPHGTYVSASLTHQCPAQLTLFDQSTPISTNPRGVYYSLCVHVALDLHLSVNRSEIPPFSEIDLHSIRPPRIETIHPERPICLERSSDVLCLLTSQVDCGITVNRGLTVAMGYRILRSLDP